MPRFFFALIIPFLLCFNHTIGQSLYREIERIIIHDTDISYELTPGFIIAIIDGDSTYIEKFGSKATQRRTPINQNDIFEIGSVTKLFTSTMFDIAREENKISFQDPVNEYLPVEYRNSRLNNITIHDLINHQSGLPKRPYGFGKKELDPQNPYKYYTKEDLLSSYKAFIPESSGPQYSHMNYALLEIILENVYKKPYEEIIDENIFLPLGMENSFVHVKEDKSILAAGLDRSGTEVAPREYASFAGSEAIKSSLNDLIRFMRVNLGWSDAPLTKVVQDNFEEENVSFNENIEVSNGWQILKINKRLDAAIHTGTTSGHSAFIGMIRTTGTGVIILSNSTFGTRDLGMLVLRMINNNWKRRSN